LLQGFRKGVDPNSNNMRNLTITLKLQLLKIITCFLLIAIPASIYAVELPGIDSLAPIKAGLLTGYTTLSFADYLSAIDDNAMAASNQLDELRDVENAVSIKPNNSKALLRLLKLMQVKRLMRHPKTSHRLYLDMAGISAKLRLYPFAMQCYYQSTICADSAANENKLFGETMLTSKINFAIDTNNIQANENLEKESVPVNVSEIEQSFNVACAVLLHVKQPLPGKRKAFAGVNNVGHTFITLIKYNTDRSIISRSFGFYPAKDGLLSATPLHPASFSVIKDDGFHAWDEVVGKFISFRRLRRILRLIDRFENKSYHLNKNNCTDFALIAAAISGIDVQETKGYWPFGKGNNPGCAGQSILEGKLKNADTGNSDGLFLWNSNLTTTEKQQK
jgi:hypothetical protein